MKKIIALAIIAIFVFSLIPLAFAENVENRQVCTQEAKLCPDGKTYVSRTGPNCEFATCPNPGENKLIGIIEKDSGTTYNPQGCGYCFTSDDGKYKCALLDTSKIGALDKYFGKKVIVYGKKYEGPTSTMCPIALDVNKIEIIEKDSMVQPTMEKRLIAEVRKEANLKRIQILKEANRAKIQALTAEKLDKIANLSAERLQKIAELDKAQIERLTALNITNLNKIAELKKERLEKLTNLSEIKLQRLSELEKDELEKISDLNETEISKLAVLNRARFKEMVKFDAEKLKADLKALKVIKIKNADDLNERNISNLNLTQFRERFEKAKEDFKEAKDALNETRNRLREAKEKRDETAIINNSKTYLLRTADVLINHLEKIKAKVQESKNIANDTEAKIVAEIDARIAEINKIKADAQAATTKEQVKEAAKKLREVWSKLKTLINLYTERVVSARVEGIVNQELVLEKRLDNILEKEKEKGVEVDVNSEMNQFSEKIATSRDKYKQAQDKLSEALDLKAKNESADTEKIKTLVNEANELLKQARDSLKDAHEILKALVKKIKEAAPGVNISDDVEVEVAQETTPNAETTAITETNAPATT